MKIRILILLSLTVQTGIANMASPYWEGTLAGTAFSSKDVDVLNENIHVLIDKDFTAAKFTIEYTIKSDTAGRQFPLLFVARDYKDHFNVWMDGRQINITEVPAANVYKKNFSFENYSHAFERDKEQKAGSRYVVVHWDQYSGSLYELSDLKYFETDLSKGQHTIRVEYTAEPWTDISGWITEHSFRYSLTPAKFWRSFGTLHITVEQTGKTKEYTTNLGPPVEGKIGSLNTWTFHKLPGEYFEVSFTPKPNRLAQILMVIGPGGLAAAFGIALFILHLLAARWYRNRFAFRRYSTVVILGSLLIPFLILLSHMYSYELIDRVIGPDAGGYHGYTFVIMILYPVLMPVYWVVMWQIDKRHKRKLLMQ